MRLYTLSLTNPIQARTYLQNLPYELKIHDSDILESVNFDFVKKFAKETGDLKTLSRTDMRVIALGVQLAKNRGEEAKLQIEPKPLTEFRPKRFEEDYKRIDEEQSESDDEINSEGEDEKQ